MAVKRQAGSEQAVIEVWREGDRVLIGVPSHEGSSRNADEVYRQVEGELQLRAAQSAEEKLLRAIFGEEHPKPKRQARKQIDAGRIEAEVLAMSEDEWLAADLLALQRQAVDLYRSADETLTYVAEKCAAVHKG